MLENGDPVPVVMLANKVRGQRERYVCTQGYSHTSCHTGCIERGSHLMCRTAKSFCSTMHKAQITCVFLFGNYSHSPVQCDLENQQVDQSLLDMFCQKNNITAWSVTLPSPSSSLPFLSPPPAAPWPPGCRPREV